MSLSSMAMTPPVLPTLVPPSAAARSGAGAAELLKGRDAAQVAHEFESMFVSMMMKAMRQASGDEGLFPGDSSDTLGGLFDMTLADHVAASGGIGVARLLKESQVLNPSPSAGTGAVGDITPDDLSHSAAGRGVYRNAAIGQE